ncbi:uncharacterized protein N0V89_005527 [Didymosphaeria variabile]|uniref:Wings apart-like protein C-terminal domain-containing protein n=1 Tax=Didymosphaeria variabile TaxID=1932322 RepID=A0A9W9CBA6_9PLEO|nr:uncharacterized protein N0V89_005527 [Didymosphaeria variabile]KAJ4353797.1 hypothetical protein N0V89_005527 [Didymosphaeria variabile]
MAMPMSSIFTGPERRKKLVTYGRAARFGNAQIFTDDEPSPERSRKQVGRLTSASQKPGAASGTKNAVDTVRVGKQQSPGLYDDFDVPSDSESRPRTAIKKPLQKPPPKPMDNFDVFDVPSSGDERKAVRMGRVKAAQQLRSKVNVTRPKVPAQQAKASDKKHVVAVSPDDPLIMATPAVRTRAKTDVADTRPTATVAAKAAKQNALAFKANARATVAPRTAPKQTKANPAPAPLVTEMVPTPPTEPNDDFAVFDVPYSDDEVSTQTSDRPRKAPIVRTKALSKPSQRHRSPSPELSAGSDTSNASHKRKRRGSASSSVTVKKINIAQGKREASVPIQRKREASIPIQRKREASIAPRSRKHQKTDDSLSPGHSANEASRPNLVAVAHDAPSNKVKRTKSRTVPVISRHTIAKAQSSPVKLHSMLAMCSATNSSRAQETLEAPIVEDESMYELPDEATPRAQGAKSAVPGSVTPRQRDLFSNLLEDGSDQTTPMPSISKLRITERTPISAFAALARSSSDIPQSKHTRKGRLIDMLKQQRAPSVNEESESDEESEADVTKIANGPAAARFKAEHHVASQKLTEAMDIDPDTQASSQTSRAPVPTADRSRTYAQQRSYLEETNLEDGLLNWDDDIEVDLPTRQGSVTESEDDSQQVTGLPELRRKGQLYKFEAETQAIIEDISGKTNTNISARRSAMMEFATQLADVSYVNQLLESAMTSSLLRAISATGDIVFDFAAAVAIIFILRTKPSYAVVEQVYQSEILTTLRKLLSSPMLSLDIHRISKDRKTNMSSSARESVADFRALILRLLDWPEADVPKLSPQLLAIKVLEELVIGLRIPGNTEAIVDDDMIGKVLDVASGPAQRLQSGKATTQDDLILETAFSALESLSISKDGQATWPDEVLRRLADMMSAFFDTTGSSPRRLVIRLCMNLANNRPKACQIFADQTFVTRLARFIVECFHTLGDDASQQPLTRVRDDLILALGAMMNLAEFSDQARLNVTQGGDELLGDLVNIFLEGSERAERADSVKNAHFLVPTGYLTIMLGNLCLNDRVRRKVISLLPGENMTLLVQKVREFVQYNQRLDQAEFEGAEGQQTLQNFTLRLMLVVERLEKAGVQETARFPV